MGDARGTVFPAATRPVRSSPPMHVRRMGVSTRRRFLGPCSAQSSGPSPPSRARCKRSAARRAGPSRSGRLPHASRPLPPMNRGATPSSGRLRRCGAVTQAPRADRRRPTGHPLPHPLVLMFGDTVEALKAFHEVIDFQVQAASPLIDTLQDQKVSRRSAVAERSAKDLYAVRLRHPRRPAWRTSFRKSSRVSRLGARIRGFSKHVQRSLAVGAAATNIEILKLKPSRPDGLLRGAPPSTTPRPVLSRSTSCDSRAGQARARQAAPGAKMKETKENEGKPNSCCPPAGMVTRVLSPPSGHGGCPEGPPAGALLSRLDSAGERSCADLPPARTACAELTVSSRCRRSDLAPALPSTAARRLY